VHNKPRLQHTPSLRLRGLWNFISWKTIKLSNFQTVDKFTQCSSYPLYNRHSQHLNNLHWELSGLQIPQAHTNSALKIFNDVVLLQSNKTILLLINFIFSLNWKVVKKSNFHSRWSKLGLIRAEYGPTGRKYGFQESGVVFMVSMYNYY